MNQLSHHDDRDAQRNSSEPPRDERVGGGQVEPLRTTGRLKSRRPLIVHVNDDFERTQNLVFTLGKARNLVDAELDAGLRDVRVNVQQLGILLTLARDNATSPVALSKLLGVHRVVITRMLDRLVRSWLVQRTRNDKDRRVVDLWLTQRGGRPPPGARKSPARY
jgi:DNA-binding MarR family transcriptional regulator